MEKPVQPESALKMLNLGCGRRFHPGWTNVDFYKSGEGVIAHNLLSGIPFEDETFDVVYHSHVLEHFSRRDGEKFIRECYRVLKPGGIIRIAVPDLEQIARIYLDALEKASRQEKGWEQNYEWIMLELFDQMVRNASGGEMAAYFRRPEIPNEEFVYGRVGAEGRAIREHYLKSSASAPSASVSPVARPAQVSFLRKLFSPQTYLNRIKRFFGGPAPVIPAEEKKYREIGKFRLGGEIHQWMYDRYSLSKLLQECGFFRVSVKTAETSAVPGWVTFRLDGDGATPFKPDSLFIEAEKPATKN
jgi:predicted SAM-dependent methyltransferase